MDISCGTDIIEIDRVKKSIQRFGNRFLNKVFTNNEIRYCESKKVQKFQSYAARFAAKEAVLKAISTQLHNKYDLSWKDIEIVNTDQGKPIVNLLNYKKENIESIDISFSHCKKYAIANVVILEKGKDKNGAI